MPHYIIEIEDEAILVFVADNVEKALELADSDAIADDLMLFQRNGLPVWNGKGDLIVREAHAIDAAIWDKAFASALSDGGANLADRDGFVVFLVAVTDSSDDEDYNTREPHDLH